MQYMLLGNSPDSRTSKHVQYYACPAMEWCAFKGGYLLQTIRVLCMCAIFTACHTEPALFVCTYVCSNIQTCTYVHTYVHACINVYVWVRWDKKSGARHHTTHGYSVGWCTMYCMCLGIQSSAVVMLWLSVYSVVRCAPRPASLTLSLCLSQLLLYLCFGT